jgi:hypothetical protein
MSDRHRRLLGPTIETVSRTLTQFANLRYRIGNLGG